MRVLANLLGGLMIAIGIVWILQGVNIMPGSFMTGQTVWAWRGAFAAVIGILLVWLVNRKHR
jgi:hypothetical protein